MRFQRQCDGLYTALCVLSTSLRGLYVCLHRKTEIGVETKVTRVRIFSLRSNVKVTARQTLRENDAYFL